jgi:hypothetical protein
MKYKIEKGKDHWEKHIVVNPQGKNTPENAFLPKRSKDRPQPHVKLNECDH